MVEESHSFPKLKRQLSFHQNDTEILMKDEEAQPEGSEPKSDPQETECPSSHTGPLQSHSGFNCVLCAQTLRRKEELLVHWEQQHKCEDPPKLWTILNALSTQGMTKLSNGFEK